MTLEEKRRMVLLEATLRELRRIVREAENNEECVPLDAALEGRLRSQWTKTLRQIDSLV
jgi:hypothetical protein